MTITNTDRSVAYIGNSATVSWDYTFQVPTVEAMNVNILNLTTGAITVLTSGDYDVTGIGGSSGGTVTYPKSGSPLAPLTSNDKIVIYRSVPQTQEVSVSNQSRYDASVVEAVWDRLTMMIQDLTEEIGRNITLPIGDTTDSSIPNEILRANKYVKFNAAGVLELDSLTFTDAPTTAWSLTWLLKDSAAEAVAALGLDTTDAVTFADITLDSVTPTYNFINGTVRDRIKDLNGFMIFETDLDAVKTPDVTGFYFEAQGVGLLQMTADKEVVGDAIATTAEAEAGTGTHLMTAEKTAEAIAALVPTPTSFNQITRQIFTTSGTYTPNPGMLYCEVEVQAAGGGGGKAFNDGANQLGGSGGGAGAHAKSILTAADIGASKPVTVGTGGAGATLDDGSDGGASSFGTLVVCGGGLGGFKGATDRAPGGVGGSATAGDLQIKGGHGRAGGQEVSPTAIVGGEGGDSQLGKGGYEIGTTSGQVGTGYGSGGSGASATVYKGGDGAPGIIIITEYCLV